MVSSRKPAPVSSWTMTCAVAAISAGLAGCQSVATEAAKSQPAAPILSSDSAAFIGLGDRELSNTLGKPKQVRKDAPAEVWQYSGADCVVDFYLYDSDPAGTDGRMEVAYVEARDLRAEAAASERCVKSLLQSVSAGGASGESF
jgi:hypothetical protein